MKTILIFIGLKLAEIAGAVLAFWLLSTAALFGLEFIGVQFGSGDSYWVKRFISILLVGVSISILIFGFVVCGKWFKANWEKAKQIGGKW